MEQLVYRTRPSLVLALDAWIMAAVACMTIMGLGPSLYELLLMTTGFVLKPSWVSLVAALPFLGALWRTIVLRCIIYEITDQRLLRRTGVFSVHWDEIELARIRDFVVRKPFYLRILGLGNLTVLSADRSTPQLHILAQRNVRWLRDGMRELVLQRQKALGYREIFSDHS